MKVQTKLNFLVRFYYGSVSFINNNNYFGLPYQQTVPLFFPNATPCKKHWNSISIILFSSR